MAALLLYASCRIAHKQRRQGTTLSLACSCATAPLVCHLLRLCAIASLPHPGTQSHWSPCSHSLALIGLGTSVHSSAHSVGPVKLPIDQTSLTGQTRPTILVEFGQLSFSCGRLCYDGEIMQIYSLPLASSFIPVRTRYDSWLAGLCARSMAIKLHLASA